MRDAIGQKWAKAKDASASMSSAYKLVGKSYTAQREFRMKWLKDEYDSYKQTKIHVQKQHPAASSAVTSRSPSCYMTRAETRRA